MIFVIMTIPYASILVCLVNRQPKTSSRWRVVFSAMSVMFGELLVSWLPCPPVSQTQATLLPPTTMHSSSTAALVTGAGRPQVCVHGFYCLAQLDLLSVSLAGNLWAAPILNSPPTPRSFLSVNLSSAASTAFPCVSQTHPWKPNLCGNFWHWQWSLAAIQPLEHAAFCTCSFSISGIVWCFSPLTTPSGSLWGYCLYSYQLILMSTLYAFLSVVLLVCLSFCDDFPAASRWLTWTSVSILLCVWPEVVEKPSSPQFSETAFTLSPDSSASSSNHG